MSKICRLLDVEKLRTTVYKPSTNAAVERFYRTLNSMLGRMIETEKDWDLMLPFVMAAYRSSRHESTGFTPNFLMLGREVHNAVDIVYGAPEAKPPASYAEYNEEMLDRFQRAYTLVREHLGEAAKFPNGTMTCMLGLEFTRSEIGFGSTIRENGQVCRISGNENLLDHG